MTVLAAFTTSLAVLVPLGGTAPPPVGVCDTSVAAIHPNAFKPDWCGKTTPAGYEEFRSALNDYRLAHEPINTSLGSVAGGIHSIVCMPLNLPYGPLQVDTITVVLGTVTRPALKRAGDARNRMVLVQKKVFGDDQIAAGVSADLEELKRVVEEFGESMINLETAAEMYRSITAEEQCDGARPAPSFLTKTQESFVKTSQRNVTLITQLVVAFNQSQEECSDVRVINPVPPVKMKRAAGAKAVETTTSGGAALTYPKTFDVGKKTKSLPVNVKVPSNGYGKITLKRGKKGVVATGGEVQTGSFGLLMKVPATTKPGTGKLTFTLDRDDGADVTVEAKITFT